VTTFFFFLFKDDWIVSSTAILEHSTLWWLSGLYSYFFETL